VNVRELLEAFATEAFRRQPPKKQYIDGLFEHYQNLSTGGDSEVEALGKTLGIVLASPSFLYLEEATKTRTGKLSPRSFATRLAYFLWSSPPDEELYRVGKSAKIFNPKILQEQVNRMLNAPRADSFFEGYMSQWAELERLNGVSVNLKEYPGYNASYKHSIGREAIEFFKVLVQKNLPVDNLIDSDFVVVNAFLADHYGLPKGDYSNEFQQVKIAKDFPRGGMITQAGFLTMGSDGNRTSPVIRRSPSCIKNKRLARRATNASIRLGSV